jgi:hypothetical protein
MYLVAQSPQHRRLAAFCPAQRDILNDRRRRWGVMGEGAVIVVDQSVPSPFSKGARPLDESILVRG